MKLIGYVIKNEPDIERYKNLAKKIYKTNIENLILENYRSSHFKCLKNTHYKKPHDG